MSLSLSLYVRALELSSSIALIDRAISHGLTMYVIHFLSQSINFSLFLDHFFPKASNSSFHLKLGFGESHGNVDYEAKCILNQLISNPNWPLYALLYRTIQSLDKSISTLQMELAATRSSEEM
ncbi:unnamed protein product [Camellia sinensis]